MTKDFIPDIVEATELVIGDMIEWLEYPPSRWAMGKVINVKHRPNSGDDSISIKCLATDDHLPQVKVGEIARRKMARLRIDKVFRFTWQSEKARDIEVVRQREKRKRGVNASMRYYYQKESG